MSACISVSELFCAGEFFNAPLGNVYAEDEDDWDVENKTFAFVDSEPERYFKYAHFKFYINTATANSFKIFNSYFLVRERSALSDPYNHSAWNSVCLFVCLSATLRSNILETKGASG